MASPTPVHEAAPGLRHLHGALRAAGRGSHRLFALGGDTDAGLPIVANIRLPRALRDTTLKKFPTLVWLSMKGAGSANLTVYGEQHEWSYSFQMQPRTGQTRCQVGRGIRENYYSLGISTPGGQAFSLDRVEVQHVESRSRRV